MKHLARLLTLAALLITAGSAFAADPIYPRGIRVGLVPAPGLETANGFVGFETSNSGVKVLLAELPAAAYGEVEAALTANPQASGAVKPETLQSPAGKAYFTAEDGKEGADAVRRYSLIVPGITFSGYVAVQVAEAERKTFTDDVVRQMLATITVRQQVPVEEQLSFMPFKIGERGDFKAVRTLAPGAAVLLADVSEDAGIEAAPFMLIGLIGSAPDNSADRGRFAQQAAGTIPGLRDGRITMSEPVRIDGAPGFETRIEATSGKDNTPVTVVQWLRFGSSNVAMRIIASTPREQWPKAFPRFRAVRDGIQMR